MSELAVDSALWIRTVRAVPQPRIRLVCFPHAGGSASFFRQFADRLDPDIEVLAVQYPGRQDRRAEAALDDIGVLSDRIYDAYRPDPETPFAFFGHSMGAVLAFEVTRRRERDAAQAPVVMFASGRRAPSRSSAQAVHLLTDDEVVAEIRALNGTSGELLLDDELVRMILPAIRSDYRAIETYRPLPGTAPLNTPIVALVGDEDPRVSVEESAAWREHTNSGFDLRVFRGGHFFLTEPRSITAVAATVSERLRTTG